MKLYKRKELRHSRIFFDQRPPAFLFFFIIGSIIILIVAVFGSTVVRKSYIVKAQGTILTIDNQYIAAQVDGEVDLIMAREGQAVKKDDILIIISNGQEGLQQPVLQQQIDELNEQLARMDRYKQSLEQKKNLMKNEGVEQEFYGKVDYYLMQLSGEKFDKDNVNKQMQEKKQKKANLQTEIDDLKNDISRLQVEASEQTIKHNEIQGRIDQQNDLLLREFDEEKQKQIEQSLTKLTRELEKVITTEEYEAKQTEKQSTIDAKKGEIESIEQEIKELGNQQMQPISQAQQTYAQLISELGAARSQTESKLTELKGQITVQTGQESPLVVKAKNDGFVHYLVPLKQGMAVQRNQTIAEVSQNDVEDVQVEAYILAQDISKVKENDTVKVALGGVNTQKYGTLQGRLTSIDSGTIVQQTEQENAVFYRCLVTLKGHKLIAGDGTVVEAIKSMPVEARIIYDKETYYEWFLKLLNFKSY